MNIRQKGVPKNSKKGKEGVVVKRNRELKYKEDLFKETLKRLEQNSDEDIVSDTE